MTFSTYNKIVEVALNQSWISWCAVINCNNKAKMKNREMSYFRLSKDSSDHKDQIHPTGHLLDNLPSKIENFQIAISKNKQNMFIAILLGFFMIYFANFIYSELPNSQAEAYSEPYQIFKMTFLAKISNISRGAFTTNSNI